ncbi:biotin/lipoyl-containing protein [Romboutsia sedimentorum]|uniref:Biotin/lipoyl-containing protein n=1 Tax=Romboutsia sedimentorum TaxID=1368474 RepID=A0ABT7EDC5_9FIRM|nr:biotin/lipoyl-containing protein [Romboutsia sedimentorum]MDK2563946.1 biotin/lipoyl-containing protein [Romboutsia sedimentorum]MDK2585318.1 biotin/lipoyl-containing protein [Romboutsia sedimentorum]
MNAKKYHITLNGKVYEVEIEEVSSTNQAVKQEIKQEIKPTPSQNSESITAPMPGTIINVLVKKGQAVKKGEVVAILEAMKMENEIVAPVDGVVEAISVDKGQNVNLGDDLLEIA